MKKVFSTIFSLAVLVLFTINVQAQIKTPAASPTCKLSQDVGLTSVSIEYSRPSVKERTIFAADGLVPYGKMWRTGANKNTMITFADDVKVEGNALKAGTYALFTVPGAEEWEVIFYTDTENWGTPRDYDEEKEAARFKVKTEALPMNVESFTMGIGGMRNDHAYLQLLWEKTYLQMKMEVSVDDKVMASIKKTMGGPGRGDYYSAAQYYYEGGKDKAQALAWVQKANEIEGKYWQYRLESKILADIGQYGKAINAANKSKKLAAEAGNQGYVDRNTKSIAEWKAKLGEKSNSKSDSEE